MFNPPQKYHSNSELPNNVQAKIQLHRYRGIKCSKD